ncbi:hypothetical protein D5018_02715 [Parashewanella curva]|uniref:Ankyrin repeat domain-containing protein n=1 Tax=Parashewanella curva TaxID=2338552 RepID=A0A3L8Q0G7_9GAMM|nr:hypothetical protein [Parashewanella curva]RLV61186.1 hypothetical protein D5018_02715 [Parashewanella curva]
MATAANVQNQTSSANYNFKLNENTFTSNVLSAFSLMSETDTCNVSFTTKLGNEVVFRVVIDKSDPLHKPYLAKFFVISPENETPLAFKHPPTFTVDSIITDTNRSCRILYSGNSVTKYEQEALWYTLNISQEEARDISASFHQLSTQLKKTMDLPKLLTQKKWRVMEEYIISGVDLNYPVQNDSEFMASLIKHYPSTARLIDLMLRNGWNPFIVNKNGTSLLHLVIDREIAGLLSTLMHTNNQDSIFDEASARQAAIQSRSIVAPKGTPLIIAIKKGQINTVNEILTCCPEALAVFKNWDEASKLLPFSIIDTKKNQLATLVIPHWKQFKDAGNVPESIRLGSIPKVLFNRKENKTPEKKSTTRSNEQSEKIRVVFQNGETQSCTIFSDAVYANHNR